MKKKSYTGGIVVCGKAQHLLQKFWFGRLAFGLFLALPALTLAAPGDLDLTFGSGGVVITRVSIFARETNYAFGMAIQSDGKIVVVGDGGLGNTWDFAVARYNTDGSLDNSFGGSGIVLTPVGDSHDAAASVAIQADGKIVVSGVSHHGIGGSSFAVVRYNPNGTLDSSFNGTGIVITSVGNSYSGSSGLAIQSDGKIIVAGSSGTGSNYDFAIIRYNTDGSLDTTFNGTGKVVTPVGGGNSGSSSVAIQSDGKIIAAGSSQSGFSAVTVVRYNTDGTLDTSFNGTGKVVTSVGSSDSGASDIAIQPNGKIVVAGYVFDTTSGFAVVRYNRDGSLDTSFGNTGITISPIGNSYAEAYSVAIQPNEKIVVAGYSTNSRGSDFAVARFNPNGSLDASFNGTGIVITPFGGQDYAVAAAIQADGKIVVAGGSDNLFWDFYDFVVVRYQGDGPIPAPTPNATPACPNPIDCPDFFVRQHYLDFLDRVPEPSGLAAWLGVLNNCAVGDLTCQHEQRLTTSAAFFGSAEFQLKGYFAFRFYRTAFARLPGYSEIAADMTSVSGQTADDVYARKTAFTNSFVQRPEFVTLFNGLPNADYVAALLGRYNLNSIITPDPSQPDGTTKVTLTESQLVSHLNAGTLTRAQVLRAIADSDQVVQLEFNRAFVAMQYYGYLRRAPETTGYNSWLNYLNAHPTDSLTMVRGFVDSIEYRMRFGQP